MSKVFISYRRDDSGGYARAIYQHLVDRFGASAVFMDLETLQPGRDFVEQIRATLDETKIMLVLIGKDWMGAAEAGIPRLDNPEDFVRLEIVLGLNAGIPLVPVLLGTTGMPSEADLPEDIRPFAKRHAVTVKHPRFAADMEPVALTIATALGIATWKSRIQTRGERARRWLISPVGVYSALVVLNLLLGTLLLNSRNVLRVPWILDLPLAAITGLAVAVLLAVPAQQRFRIEAIARDLRWAATVEATLLFLLIAWFAFSNYVLPKRSWDPVDDFTALLVTAVWLVIPCLLFAACRWARPAPQGKVDLSKASISPPP